MSAQPDPQVWAEMFKLGVYGLVFIVSAFMVFTVAMFKLKRSD